MELMAASRVVKAQQAVRESTPCTRGRSPGPLAVATFSNEDHPLTSEKEDMPGVGVLIIAADRGLAGGWQLQRRSRESERLVARLVERARRSGPTWSGAAR